jgi:hypothetical protein
MQTKLCFLFLLSLIINCTAVFSQFSPTQKDLQISSKEKSQIIDTIIKAVKHSYVFPKISSQIETMLLTHERKGDYNKIISSKEFADTISNQLTFTSNDKHLRILYSYDTIPQKTNKEPPLPDFIKTFALENNYGFNKIDILDGNIGYINILGFFPFDEATQKAIASFDFLSGTKALIVDLRENTGGYAPLANFMISYFFNKQPVKILENVFRDSSKIEQMWSSFYVPGKRYLNRPVYVLTSSGTFSAGEAFAYILQGFHKAIVVGERTGGGANLCDLIRLNDHFVMNLPVGRPVSPFSKSNWEAVGVQPDIAVSKEKALITAHIAALQELIKNCTDKTQSDKLKDILARVKKTSN